MKLVKTSENIHRVLKDGKTVKESVSSSEYQVQDEAGNSIGSATISDGYLNNLNYAAPGKTAAQIEAQITKIFAE